MLPPASAAELRAPDGFEIAPAAEAGVVRFPMFGTFDDRGRLFVTESSGGDLYEELTSLAKTCRISVLEDADGDGTFESARVFADELIMPMGLAWRDGRLYVAEGPAMITLEDTDGDGTADARETVLDGFGHSDNGSLHGTIFGPDGLLYMTIGQPDGYRFISADGREVWGKTGGLIRCRPDGSHPEVLCRGFENLVEIVFLPTGEIVGTDNWFQRPSGGIRDALVHLVPGGKYPIKDDHGSPLPVTGGDLPAVAKFPAVAVSGLARCGGTGTAPFPAVMRGSLFSAQFNARRVQRHVLSRDGATFQSEDSDFVTTDDPDFHPSDVLFAPDGSLIVIDTGAWYVQHCPTGRIRDTYAPGGIYRIRFTGEPEETATPAAASLAEMWSQPTPEVREALASPDANVAALAARIVGARKDRTVGSALIAQLRRPEPHVRLAAAEALAECGSEAALPSIWDALCDGPDRILRHALIHAALKIADGQGLRAALASSRPPVIEAALIILDQPPHESLAAADVMPCLSSDDAALRQAAMDALKRHPDWADSAAATIRQMAAAAELSDAEQAQIRSLVAAIASQPVVQSTLAELLEDDASAVPRRVMLLDALAYAESVEFHDALRRAVSRLLASKDPDLKAAAVKTIAVLQPDGFDEAIAAVAQDVRADPSLRLEALRALAARRPEAAANEFEFLASQLQRDVLPLRRLAAAQILAQSDSLAGVQRAQVRDAVRSDPLVQPILAPDKSEKTTDAQRAALEKYAPLESAERGDPDAGRRIFFGKAGCAVCHQVGADGGSSGPDLTRIGAVRARRDLIESIVLPSASFAQKFEPYAVTTTDGQSAAGMIAHESPSAITLRDAAGADRRIPRDEISDITPLPVSLMPPGLDLILTDAEFADLLAFLEGLR